jgi:hypothetical protein
MSYYEAKSIIRGEKREIRIPFVLEEQLGDLRVRFEAPTMDEVFAMQRRYKEGK